MLMPQHRSDIDAEQTQAIGIGLEQMNLFKPAAHLTRYQANIGTNV
jgi:hypothetical protein